MAKALSEHEIQTQILQWLTIRRYMHWRNNSGGMKKGAHWVRFGGKGQPDIFVVRQGSIIGIEVKDGKGEQSRWQKEFQSQLELAGGRYLVARSLQDVIDALK